MRLTKVQPTSPTLSLHTDATLSHEFRCLNSCIRKSIDEFALVHTDVLGSLEPFLIIRHKLPIAAISYKFYIHRVRLRLFNCRLDAFTSAKLLASCCCCSMKQTKWRTGKTTGVACLLRFLFYGVTLRLSQVQQHSVRVLEVLLEQVGELLRRQ